MTTEPLHPLPSPEAALLMAVCGTLDVYERARIERLAKKQYRQSQAVRGQHGWSSSSTGNGGTANVFVFRV